MMIQRKEFLRQLESCAPGISNTDNIEQGNCFILSPKQIVSFNDEILCKQDSVLDGIFCAVPAKPLLETLRKLTEDEVSVELKESQLLIKCPGVRRVGITVFVDAIAHAEAVESPEAWNDVPPIFADALATVAECAAKDSDTFELTCIEISPQGLQATDAFQAIRYRLECPVKESLLIRKSACSAVNGLGVAAIAETENWVHFKTYTGLRVSVRRYSGEFPNLAQAFKAETQATVALPPSLLDTIQKAAAFFADTGNGKQAQFRLREKQIMIRAQNESGFYEEVRDVQYNGPSRNFGMNPKYLQTLLKYDYPIALTESSLRIRGENFAYITSTEVVV
jgi:DNA polymerase III sliding clamp (beta) subunit (PCNA family)